MSVQTNAVRTKIRKKRIHQNQFTSMHITHPRVQKPSRFIFYNFFMNINTSWAVVSISCSCQFSTPEKTVVNGPDTVFSLSRCRQLIIETFSETTNVWNMLIKHDISNTCTHSKTAVSGFSVRTHKMRWKKKIRTIQTTAQYLPHKELWRDCICFKDTVNFNTTCKCLNASQSGVLVFFISVYMWRIHVIYHDFFLPYVIFFYFKYRVTLLSGHKT